VQWTWKDICGIPLIDCRYPRSVWLDAIAMGRGAREGGTPAYSLDDLVELLASAFARRDRRKYCEREAICTVLDLLSLSSSMGSHWECTTLFWGPSLTPLEPDDGELIEPTPTFNHKEEVVVP
jgi:hypothetical protein